MTRRRGRTKQQAPEKADFTEYIHSPLRPQDNVTLHRNGSAVEARIFNYVGQENGHLIYMVLVGTHAYKAKLIDKAGKILEEIPEKGKKGST
jgi:hypothetical protein